MNIQKKINFYLTFFKNTNAKGTVIHHFPNKLPIRNIVVFPNPVKIFSVIIVID